MRRGAKGETPNAFAQFTCIIYCNTASSFHGSRMRGHSSLCFGEILLIDLEADEVFHPAFLGCDGGISDSEKRINHCFDARDSVQLDAPFRQLDGECRRMRSFLGTTLNC